MTTSSWLLLLVSVAQTAQIEPAAVSRVDRTLFVMGTELNVSVEARDREAGLRAAENAVRALEATEARLSTWRSDSELARLNRAAAGEPVALSPDLASDLEDARWCWEATSGAFDPTVGALVEVWGLRRGGHLPTTDELARARAATGMDGLRLAELSAVRLRPGLVLDEGGFGKGVGLAAAAAALRSDPAVRRSSVDLGGQLLLLGAETSWFLDIADPRERHRKVIELVLDGGSVATSGNGERGVELGPYGRSHLLDPRSGTPARDFGSLTVWTESPARADCLSTGLYVLGPEAALSWAVEHPGVEILVLEPVAAGLRGRATTGLGGRLRALVPELHLEIVSRRIVSAGTPASFASTPGPGDGAVDNRGRRASHGDDTGPFALYETRGR